ncbi:hypothetical protein OROGR_027899 [Orobanche gracilis]
MTLQFGGVGYMDRSWITTTKPGDSKYKAGVTDFINFTVRNSRGRDKLPCPCFKCHNLLHRRVDEILNHLNKYAFDRTYSYWIFHGEVTGSMSSTSKEGMSEGYATYEGDRLEDMLPISPWNGVVFWLDPTGVEKNIHEYVQQIINEGITKFSEKYRTDVKKFDKNNPGIRWIKTQCPRQPQNSKDCGYYVCRFMLETIQKRRQVIPDKYFGGANASFPQVKIDKLRDMWIEYVNEHKQVADEELDDGMNGI